MTDFHHSSLSLARELRVALQMRNEAMMPAELAYDLATTESERTDAAANLLATAGRTDFRYRRLVEAAQRRHDLSDAKRVSG